MKRENLIGWLWRSPLQSFGYGLALLLTLACSSLAQSNLLRNPGFELGTMDWYTYGSGLGDLNTTTNSPHSGTYAGIVTGRTDKWQGPVTSIFGMVEPDATYHCSAWVRIQNSASQQVSMTVLIKTNNGTGYIKVGEVTASSNRWTYIEGDLYFLVNGVLNELSLYFEGPAAGVDLVVDDVTVAPPFRYPPTVSFISPTNGTRCLPGTNLTLFATASDRDGTVSAVEFYNGTQRLGVAMNAPYRLGLSNLAAGTYNLSARAIDNSGMMATSSAVVVAAPDNVPVSFYPKFTSATDWSLQGSATIVSNRLRLTSSLTNRAGAAWLAAQQDVQDGFLTTFQVQMAQPKNGGGEGLAFVIQNQDAAALGSSAGGLGFASIPNSLAVEFDVHRNPANVDPNAHHISVHCQGREPNRAFEPTSLGQVQNIPDLDDGAIHTVTLRYVPGKLMVFVDNPAVPLLSVLLRLEDWLDLETGKAWVGFTAATGDGSYNQDLLLWSFWPDLAPSVRLRQPLEADLFLSPATIFLAAEAGDSNSRFVCVDYYANDFYLGSALSTPFALDWTNVPPGHYELRVEAIDAFGATSDSNPVHITVEEAPRLTQFHPQADHSCRLEINSNAGRTYSIQRSADLSTWETVGTVTGIGGLQQWTDPASPMPATARFYRLLVQP